MSRGNHICLDYTGFHPAVEDSANWMLALLIEAVDQSSARRVHAHVEAFDGAESPPGFAAVVLLDESHISAHCYAEEGLLAIDCFTCGETDPAELTEWLDAALQRACPGLSKVSQHRIDRFGEA